MKLFCWNYLQENWIPAKTSPLRLPRENCRKKQELLEKIIFLLGTFYPSAGFCDEVLHLYFCKVASIGASHPDEDEFIEPILIPIEKAVEMVLNNEIPDGKTQVAVLKAAMLVNHKSLIEKRKRRYIYLRFSFLYIISVNLSLSFQIFCAVPASSICFCFFADVFCRFCSLFIAFLISFLSLYSIYKLFYHLPHQFSYLKMNENRITALSYFFYLLFYNKLYIMENKGIMSNLINFMRIMKER